MAAVAVAGSFSVGSTTQCGGCGGGEGGGWVGGGGKTSPDKG